MTEAHRPLAVLAVVSAEAGRWSTPSIHHDSVGLGSPDGAIDVHSCLRCRTQYLIAQMCLDWLFTLPGPATTLRYDSYGLMAADPGGTFFCSLRSTLIIRCCVVAASFVSVELPKSSHRTVLFAGVLSQPAADNITYIKRKHETYSDVSASPAGTPGH